MTAQSLTVGLVALIIGLLAGIAITVTLHRPTPFVQKIKPTTELLGEVTTDVGPGANAEVDKILGRDKDGNPVK